MAELLGGQRDRLVSGRMGGQVCGQVSGCIGVG